MDRAEDELAQLDDVQVHCSENSNEYVSGSGGNGDSGEIILKKPIKWFKSKGNKQKENIVKRNYIWSFLEKELFSELPEGKTKNGSVKLDEEEITTKLSEQKSSSESDIEEQETEEIKFLFKYYKIRVVDICECGVTEHPSNFSDYLIDSIHENLYRIRHKGLKVDDDMSICDMGDIRFIKICMDMQTHWTKKVEEFLRYVDIELGYYEGCIHQPSDRQVYLALDAVNIIGCAVVEPIKFGYKIVPPLKGYPMKGPTVPVDLGVNRIWVFMKYRRLGYATILLDIARGYFMNGIVLNKSKVAFAEPNRLGRHFAFAYCGRGDVIGY